MMMLRLGVVFLMDQFPSLLVERLERFDEAAEVILGRHGRLGTAHRREDRHAHECCLDLRLLTIDLYGLLGLMNAWVKISALGEDPP